MSDIVGQTRVAVLTMMLRTRQFVDILLADAATVMQHTTRHLPEESEGRDLWPSSWPLTDPLHIASIAQNQRKWRHAKSIVARESDYKMALPINNISER